MAVQRDKVIASAEKLVAKGKIEPAIKEYERLLDDNPNDVNTLNRIGDLWVRLNRNDEAVKAYGKIADHYAKDGFFLKAIAIFKKINKLDPSKLDVYAKLADLYAKQGLAMEAKSQYQVLADYYIKHGDPAAALTTYRKISELDPNSINVHVKMADLHSQVGHTAEALKEYDRVGRMLLKRGMLDEAVQVFKKALKIDPKNVELVESLVTALGEAKDYENAQKIVEHALEANKEHPRLLGLWGRILIGKGDVPSAQRALQRGLTADPNDPLIRETLADLSLKQNDASRALEMLVPLVERAVSRGERGIAVEMLHKVLRVDQGHTPTLERLVALYTRLNEETNILSSMNSLAEAHISRGEHDKAAVVLDKLIQREPQNAQHRTKLQHVRSQMGGTSAPTPSRRNTVADAHPLPPMEIDEPEPSFEESPAISLDDIQSTPSLDLDFTSDSPGHGRLLPAVEQAGMESDVVGGDDLDFITEHLTEAEVFAKYGLAEKAAEHLRAVIDRSPKHAAAYDRLFRIQLDEGNVGEARGTATRYISILEESGDRAAIDAVHSEFLVHGQSLGAPPASRAAPPPVSTPADADSLVASELESSDEMSFDLDAGPTSIDVDLEATPQTETEPEIELDAGAGIEMELELEPEPEPELQLEVESDVLEEIALDQPAPAIEEAPEPFFGVESVAYEEPEVPEVPEPAEPTPEEMGEVDFYVEQEMFDEARAQLESLIARFPENTTLAARRVRLEAASAAAAAAAAAAARKAAAIAAAAAKPKPVPPAPKPVAPAPKPAPVAPPKPAPPPPPPPPEEIESELFSAFPEEEAVVIPAPAPRKVAPAPPPAPAMTATPVQEENLFADEDDFFDLAAELESELDAGEEVVSLSEEEQSLEEIFKEFKKGVEQQLDAEDYDTHYNLGIAYKEMGLIDEAIGEFQLASKDPKRAVECASMLGLCFLEKGMPQLAIKWYRKGLEMPEISEEEHIGLLYDLGSGYLEVGDTENAQKAFLEVYSLNSNYREIVTRIKQLEDARK